MPINFDFENVNITEFGLGLDSPNRDFVFVPVDEVVQKSLVEMVSLTKSQMQDRASSVGRYQPSEKYASIEYLTFSLNDPLVQELKILHESENVPEDCNAFDNINQCFAYFVKLTDNNRQRITAVRRSTQFKTLIKKRHRLVQYVDNTLKSLEETVFKLDNDFDFIIQNDLIHILRPSGLEFTAQLQKAIMDAVPVNIASIASEIDFVNFDSISQYAQNHPRAARYIASIKSQSEAINISQDKLERYCEKTNVVTKKVEGKIILDSSQIMGFLEVLDRRRYEIDLKDDGESEVYRAPSRSRVNR
ncbi:Kiwa anti-phage protein KwaB-like domain-containing protein [Proteus mirabilis]|uniref:Kiwa anti-phage protein KwaB-like domain-containing protein n=1 Tax=Proteus mirabilis TaxID=584 RepID=UPI0039B3DE60